MGLYGPIEHKYCHPFAERFADSTEFLNWVLARIGLPEWVGRSRSLKAEQTLKRPTAKFWWKNHFCSESRCECPGLEGREVDILLFCRRDDGATAAIHVECKRPGDRFSEGQAKGYPIRANCWISGSKGPRNLLRHDHFTTLLLCDRAALHSFEDLSHFKGVIYFDEIAEFITPYPAIP